MYRFGKKISGIAHHYQKQLMFKKQYHFERIILAGRITPSISWHSGKQIPVAEGSFRQPQTTVCAPRDADGDCGILELLLELQLL